MQVKQLDMYILEMQSFDVNVRNFCKMDGRI